MSLIVFIRGGGDLASGAAIRLHRAGVQVIISELDGPLVVRRGVSFASAIFEGQTVVEDVIARKGANLEDAFLILADGAIPVIVDPELEALVDYQDKTAGRGKTVLVDGRMTKGAPRYDINSVDFLVGMGPGFIAGYNCHAAIETNRGHNLGRVIWTGAAQANTGIPEMVSEYGVERVLRAPSVGELVAFASIGDHLQPGQLVAEVAGQPVTSPFKGVLRGLVYPGLKVPMGLKIGDVDPRDDPRFCTMVSDKSLAVGGGVLEAILSQPELRPYLWD